MSNDLLYRIALTRVPYIGDVHARILIQQLGTAEQIFKTSIRQLEKIEGIGSVRANNLKKFNDYISCEQEIRFIEEYHIATLFITDQEYPKRLLHCYDAPTMLYYKGNANLNCSRVVAIVGTRNYNEYGKNLCEEMVAGLSHHDVLTISGLAFGIDTIAHKASLKHGLPTVAALAHGLDRIYPWQNKGLAKQMTTQGGLLTDFGRGTQPDKQNFPRRNRIVAGLCDALVVIQSGTKGGSLITANLANDYNKDVYALPGRVDDMKSEGCHSLIKDHKAELITCAADILNKLNWNDSQPKKIQKQKMLFPELSENERKIIGLLQENIIHVDEIHLKSGLSSSSMAAVLLSLEMKSIIKAFPGKTFRLV